ncbi:hypothetical protein ACOME3_008173 [Neoechinorhynchus agilis]
MKIKSNEVKLRNLNDHVVRLEEKDVELQRTHLKLRERYAELFKQHYEHINGAGTFRQSQCLDSTFIIGSESCSLLPKSSKGYGSHVNDGSVSPTTPLGSGFKVLANLSMEFDDSSYEAFKLEADSVRKCKPIKEFDKSELKNYNGTDEESEFAFEDGTASLCDSNENSIQKSLYGMTHEVDKLISENAELIETKNALNILKNDLIQRIEELSTQLEISREEWATASAQKQKYKIRVAELEKELDVLKTDTNLGREVMEDDTGGDRRLFTREEICRVLNEKNKYKQMYMELDEALKWQNTVRCGAEGADVSERTGKRTRIWQFFSTLLSGSSASVDSGISGMSRSFSHSPSLNGLYIRPKTARKHGSNFHISSHAAPEIKHTDIGERSLENHWFAPTTKGDSRKLPIFCCNLEKCFHGVERFYMASSYTSHDSDENHWWLVVKKANPTSQVLVLGKPEGDNELIEVKSSFNVNDQLIGGCLCFVPGTEYNEVIEDFDVGCEFCRRDKEIGKAIDYDQNEDYPFDKCTAWLGGHHGSLSIHDAETTSRLATIKLEHSIMTMIHHRGRVFCGLSNGTLVIFHRNHIGLWPKDPNSSFVHRIKMSDSGHNSVRALCGVSRDQCWCGIRNQIYVVDQSLTVVDRLEVSPLDTNQIRFICTTYRESRRTNDERNPLAFVTVRWTSCVYIYDVYSRVLIQDIDVDPFERSVIGSPIEKSGLVLVKISYIHVIDSQLWIGTNNGNLICIDISRTKDVTHARNFNNPVVNPIDKALISAECHLSEVELIASGSVLFAQGVTKNALISFGIGSKTLAPCPITHPSIPSIEDLYGAPSTGLLWLID